MNELIDMATWVREHLKPGTRFASWEQAQRVIRYRPPPRGLRGALERDDLRDERRARRGGATPLYADENC